MRGLLDTNVLMDAFAGQRDSVKAMVAARAANPDWVGFSAITRLGILGFAGLTPADEKDLRALLAELKEVQVVPEVVDEAIRIRKSVRIKTPNAPIVATTLVENAQLVTRNITEFQRIPAFVVVDSSAF
jgi:predicted nucleic acid-binding protein